VENEKITEDDVIRHGGWNARFARVRLIVQDNDVAVTIVDGNGDGAEFETECWWRGPKGWRNLISSGGIGSGMGSVFDDGAMTSCVGIAEPHAIVTVRFRGESYDCEANDLGYWGFVRRTDDVTESPEIVA